MKKFLLCIILIITFAACTTKETDKTRITIAMPTTSEPEYGFDPAYGWGAGEHVHEPLIQSTLTRTTTDLDIEYDLATSIETSEDGLLYRVTIRNDVQFSNGEKLTAQDVAFTFNNVKKLSTVSDFTMLDNAIATSEYEVEFRLNKPYSSFLYTISNVGIVPEKYYDENYGLNPIGSGRYILKQWDKGQQIILEANPNYYGNKAEVKTVVIVFMSEDAAFAAVKASEIDIAYTSATYSKENINGYTLMSIKSVDNRGMNLPTVEFDGKVGNDVTSDEFIRNAISVGINKQEIIDNVLQGHGSIANSVCDGLPWYNENCISEYDFAKAEEILKSGGWIKNNNGILEKNNLKAKLEIYYPAGDSVRQAIAANVANQLIKLGFDATFKGVGWDTGYDDAQKNPLVWGWGSHSPMEVYNIYHTKLGEEYARYSPYSNSKVDELMDKALCETDLQKSFELWKQAQEVAFSSNSWIWLVNIDHLYWCNNDLIVAKQKIHPHGQGWSLINNVDEWSWKD